MSACQVRVYQYDNSYSFIKYIDYTQLEPSTAKSFSLSAECRYIRMAIRKSSSLPEFDKPHLKVSNVHKDEYYDIRPEDDGYQKLTIVVNTADPTASDDGSWEMQEDTEFLPDYGLLVLPETYSNTGKPTRLIIYCHGAGVHYSSSVTRFPSTNLQPEYWLKEGYAVMDIEGNPFDNSNPHGYIPQARQTYEKAYNWVINTYNICKDGVFIGGRSMGGGMCFELMDSSIPVLAACPLVPVCNQLWWWNYMNESRRSFCAEKMGFIGEIPLWTSDKMMSDDEYKYLYDNFDKMVKYSPIWRGIENLPDKDELFNVGHLSANTSYDEAEAALYSSLRYKANAPVKIFACHEDNIVPPKRNAELMYQMLKNAGQICELRMFNTDAASPHNFELQDSNYLTDITTVYGETMQAPLVYVEMLKFWRRYEPLQ